MGNFSMLSLSSTTPIAKEFWEFASDISSDSTSGVSHIPKNHLNHFFIHDCFGYYLNIYISINGHIIILIIFAIFFFICKKNKINNCLIICFKDFLAQTNIPRCYTITQTLMFTITPAFVSGVKLSKKACGHHIEHEPVFLTSEDFFVC